MNAANSLLTWLRSLAAGAVLLVGPSISPAHAAEEPGANRQPERVIELGRDGEVLRTAEAPTRSRRAEVVTIGGNAQVGRDESASEVVVIHGDAVIDGEVRGDVVSVLGNVTITGSVGGDVVVVLGEATINGRVKGETVLVASESTFGPNADTRGQIIAVGIPPAIDPAATIAHSPQSVALGPLPEYFRGFRDYLVRGMLLGRPFPPSVGWVWGMAGLFLAFHLLLAAVLAQPLRACMDTVREQPARSFLFGLLACILVGPVSILLSFTVVAPLLIWLAFFAFCVFGRVTVYAAAGAAVGRASGAGGLQHPVPALLVGSALFYLSYMIPFVGFLVYGLVLPLGLGAVLIRLFETMRRERGPSGGLRAPVPGSGAPAMTAATALAAGSPGPATHAFVPPSPAPSSIPAEEPIAGPEPMPQPPEIAPEVPFTGAQAAALTRVGFWPRLGAVLIDVVLIAAVNGMTFGVAKSFWLLLAIYHVAMWSWKGTTVGGAILNLRVVRLDGRPMDWQTSIVRALGAVVSLIPLGLGFFWASWDPECQSWHDRIAGTTVVRLDRRVALV